MDTPNQTPLTLGQLRGAFVSDPDSNEHGPFALIKLTAGGAFEVVSETVCNAVLRRQAWRDGCMSGTHQVLDYTKTVKGKIPKTVRFTNDWYILAAAAKDHEETHFTMRAKFLGQLPATWDV